MQGNDFKIKTSKKGILIIIVFILLTLIVGTIALLTWKSKETALVLKVGNDDDTQVVLKPYQLDKSIIPVLNYDGEDYIDVTVTNNSSVVKTIKLYYDIDEISPELTSVNFKYTITKSINNGSSYEEYRTGNFSNVQDNNIVDILSEDVLPDSKLKYRVYIWYDGNNGISNEIQGKKFVGELRASIDTFSFEFGQSWDTVGENTFVVPQTGYYKIELWGAAGGGAKRGKGGYTSGIINLKKDDKLYFYIGGQGGNNNAQTNVGGYNGGGYSGNCGGVYSYGGGGSTDVRLVSGEWDNEVSLKSRIMVAAGGAGSINESSSVAGGGGGLIGIDATTSVSSYNTSEYLNKGSTQTEVGFAYQGAKRQGGFGYAKQSITGGYGGGGGGGYYGGTNGYGTTGSGGSSYISGHTGCVAITSANSLTPRKGLNNADCSTGIDDNLCSVHYSGKKFTDTVMIDGKGFSWTNVKGSQRLMPKNGESYYEEGLGNDGDGAARITFVSIDWSKGANYDYVNSSQEYVVPKNGYYKIELWGASGGIAPDYLNNAQGGYVSGNIYLNENEKLIINVGQRGEASRNASFNGGGGGGVGNGSLPGWSGGGATDIRLNNNIKSRIMVAGGGGGGTYGVYNTGGDGSYAGGLKGYAGVYYSGHSYDNQNGKGGTQTSGGTAGNNIYSGTGIVNPGIFGAGGNNESVSASGGGGGGGGGYYGGGAGGATGSGGSGNGGGGGSSYISGHTGCVAIVSDSNTNPRKGKNNSNCEIGSSDNLCSIHYSGKKFIDTVMIDGSGYAWTNVKNDRVQMPTPDGGYYAIGQGHVGNGHAKISYIGRTLSYGADILISKANDLNISTYEDGNKTEMYAFTPSATTQVPHPTTEYRYIGNKPNNYINFNEETWRIIGVFDGKIKIMKDTSIGSYSWDNKSNGTGSSNSQKGSNDWTDSKLKEVLNSGPYWNRGSGNCPKGGNNVTEACNFSTNGLTFKAKSQIVKTKFYLGGNMYDNTTHYGNAETLYQKERGTEVYTGVSRPISWEGYVGLIYPSDYVYTRWTGEANVCFDDVFSCGTNPENSWMHDSIVRWTITPFSNLGDDVFRIGSSGDVNGNFVDITNVVQPVVYLKHDIKLSGTGTSNDPYKIK